MNEDRLERLEEKLEGLRTEMRVGFHDVHRTMSGQLADVDRRIAEGFADVHRTIAEGFDRMRESQEDLYRHMLVLHESTKADIRALAPDFAPVRREFREADAALREEFDRRLTPLEAWARDQQRQG